MDLVRLITALLAAGVIVTYSYSLGKLATTWWCHRHSHPGRAVYAIGLGRLLRGVCLVLVAVGSLQGCMELWGENVTLRNVWVILGWLAALGAWFAVERKQVIPAELLTKEHERRA